MWTKVNYYQYILPLACRNHFPQIKWYFLKKIHVYVCIHACWCMYKYTEVHICTCARVVEDQRAIFKWHPQKCHLPPLGSLSLLSISQSINEDCCSGSLRDPPRSASRALGLQAHTSIPGKYGFLGPKSRSSNMFTKYFSNWGLPSLQTNFLTFSYKDNETY